jgi:hypothetical protein
MNSNYPPGVTGNEPEIAGVDHDPRCEAHEDYEPGEHDNHRRECSIWTEDDCDCTGDMDCRCAELREDDAADEGDRKYQEAKDEGRL